MVYKDISVQPCDLFLPTVVSLPFPPFYNYTTFLHYIIVSVANIKVIVRPCLHQRCHLMTEPERRAHFWGHFLSSTAQQITFWIWKVLPCLCAPRLFTLWMFAFHHFPVGQSYRGEWREARSLWLTVHKHFQLTSAQRRDFQSNHKYLPRCLIHTESLLRGASSASALTSCPRLSQPNVFMFINFPHSFLSLRVL